MHERLPSRRLLAATLIAVASLASGGCQSSLRVTVESAPTTNDGKPLYVMIAALDGHSLLAESYEIAASRLFKNPRDTSVLHRESIFPGHTKEFTISKPDEGDVAVYVFFTNPGRDWRHPLRTPVPSDVVVELGKNNIKRLIVRSK